MASSKRNDRRYTIQLPGPEIEESPRRAQRHRYETVSPHLVSPKSRSGTNVRVIARFRPLIELESEIMDYTKQVTYVNDNQVALYQGNSEFQTFSFDRVFTPDSTQQDLFDCVGQPICTDVVTGYNGTVFAYGQTGSGKTYSMMGEDLLAKDERGIIPRWAEFLFNYVNKIDSDSEFTIKISMIEIYKECIHDLLNPEQDNMQIKEDQNRGIYIKDLTEYSVVWEEELLQIIAIGEGVRTVAATKMNKYSSRSHQIVQIEVIQKLANMSEKRGKLNLVDLAGSEKIKRTGVTGKNLEEAKKINMSLSSLGNVIYSLCKGKEHIPYRDSKITRLLQESLGGNYKTSLIVACSPHPNNFEDTISTLKFAQRAKTIKNKAHINLRRSPAEYIRIINKLKGKLKTVKDELATLRGYIPNEISAIEKINDEIQEEENSGSLLPTPRTSSPVLEPKSSSEFGDFTIDLTGVMSADVSRDPSPRDHSRLAYMQATDKLKRVERENSDLYDKIDRLKEQLSNVRMEDEKKTKKLNEFAEKYRTFVKNTKSTNVIEQQKYEIRQLLRITSKLKYSLKMNDFKYKNLLSKVMEAGLQIDDLEFERFDLNDIIESEDNIEDKLEKSIQINYVDLTIDPETIFEVNPYSQKIREKMGDQAEMSKQLEIFHLKNQLTQAQLFNYDIGRCMSFMECELFLARTRNNCLESKTEQQAQQIEALERMLDTLHDAFKYTVRVNQSETMTHYWESTYNTAVPDQQFTDLNRPPTYNFIEKANNQLKVPESKLAPVTEVDSATNSPKMTEMFAHSPPKPSFFSPSTFTEWSDQVDPQRSFENRRTLTPNENGTPEFNAHDRQLTQRPTFTSLMKEQAKKATIVRNIQRSPNITRSRCYSELDSEFGSMVTRSLSRLPSVGGRTPDSNAGLSGSVTQRNMENSYEVCPYELKHAEIQLNTQRLYNIQLVKQNSMLKDENEMLNSTIKGLENRNKEYHMWHFEHWNSLFKEYKANLDFELKRKQDEINQLNEVLYKWVKEYMSMQSIQFAGAADTED